MKIVDRYLVLVLFVFIQSLASVPANAEYVNSIDMKMHPVPQGKFIMGNELSQVKALTEEWINLYNRQRPHDSLNGLTPERFLLKYGRNHTADTENREIDFLSKFGKQA